jgi:uncharacterized protein (TIGR03067 family)
MCCFMTHTVLAVSVGLGFLLGATVVRAEDARDVTKKLAGTWKVESARVNGTDAPLAGGQVTFSGDRMTTRVGGKEETVSFRVDPSKKPPTIDFASVDQTAKGEAPGKGIYDLDGDTLKLCIGSADQRPTQFSDKGTFLAVLKRQKP